MQVTTMEQALNPQPMGSSGYNDGLTTMEQALNPQPMGSSGYNDGLTTMEQALNPQSMGNDAMTQWLMEMIKANQGNPQVTNMILPLLIQSMMPMDPQTQWARDMEEKKFGLDRDATLIDAYNIARDTGDPRADSIWDSVAEGRGFEESADIGYHTGWGRQYQNYLDSFYRGEMNLEPDDYNFYKYMAGADEDTMRKFQEDKAYGGAWWGRGPKGIKGTSIKDIFSPEAWSLDARGETYARDQLGL